MAETIRSNPFTGFLTPPNSPEKIQLSPSCRRTSPSLAYRVPNRSMNVAMPLVFPDLTSPSKRLKREEFVELNSPITSESRANLFGSFQKTVEISTTHFEKKESPKKTVKKEEKKRPCKKGSIMNFKSPLLFDNGNGTSSLIISTPNLFLSKKDLEEKKTVTLTLTRVAEGNFHKCWKVSFNGKTYAIKTFKGTINILDKTTAYKDTVAAYKLLQARNDISVATWHNSETMPTDGFYIYDFVEGEEPTYTDSIRSIFLQMILDHTVLLEDFTPANVRLIGEEIVVIDPYFSHDFDRPERIIASNIKSWFKSNLHELPLEIEKIDALLQDKIISPIALEKWGEAKAILMSLIS